MSMAFRIVHEPITNPPTLPGIPRSPIPDSIEWITPSDWDQQQAEDSFRRRFPNSRILSCRPLFAEAA